MTTMRQLLKGSMRLINVIGTGEEPTADDMDIALQSLNGLVQSMGNDLNNIYTVQPYYFPLVAGQQHYTLGPAVDEAGNLTGADWVIKRPMRIEQARLLLYPTITYPTEPVPTGCQFVCSQEDADTTVLWHFDEVDGDGFTYPVIYDNDLYFSSFSLQPDFWQLAETCCSNGVQALNISADNNSEQQLMNGGAFGSGFNYEAGATIEFLLRNDGSTDPGVFDYSEVLRSDGFSYGEGEGLIILRAFKVGQSLNFVRGSDVENPIVSVELPVNQCTAIALEWTPEGFLNIYANGVQVFTADVLYEWGTAEIGDVIGNFTFYSIRGASAHNLAIDEFRGSNIVRYSSPTYNYLV